MRRDKPRQESLSEALRRTTEARWTDDLSSADGGGVCDWDGGHDHGYHGGQADDGGDGLLV